jgi:hypothetical protein
MRAGAGAGAGVGTGTDTGSRRRGSDSRWRLADVSGWKARAGR